MTSLEAANDDLLRSNTLSSDQILERVDEYSLYCHYLGYEPIPHTGKYRSPIRTDDEVPSFGIFYTTKYPDREFLWKDQANGRSGDIFSLVQYMHRYNTKRQAELKVMKDFKLGQVQVEDRQALVYHPAPARTDIDIRVTSRAFTEGELTYWRRYNISRELLSRYQVTAIKYYWLTADQTVPTMPREFAFAYRIWKQYKLYLPFEDKQYKFRNNFTDQHIEGLLQLEYKHRLLVITKSLKDVMFFASLGYEAISPRSENTPLLPQHIEALASKYAHVVTFFDNDGKHRRDFYPFPHHEVPPDSGEKDPTDYCYHYGLAKARDMVNTILNPYL